MRIRSIKPEFWTSEDIASLDWPTRLVFIGLWSYVDDNGVGRDSDKLIKAALFPLEEDPRETLATVSRGLQNLSEGGQITRYSVDNKAYIYINAWESHQRIDKPNKARYPDLTCGNAVIRETLATVSRATPETLAPGAGEQGNRGAGEQGKETPSRKRSENEPPDRFTEFWNTYGKKVDRKKAEAAYRTALKKPGVTEALLVAAAAAYVTYQMGEGKHPQFSKDPVRWLQGECWTDERPARAAPKGRVQEHLALVAQLAEREQTQMPTPFQIGPA